MRASLSLLSKTELFTSLRHKALALCFLSLLFILSLFFEYKRFEKIIEFDDYVTMAWVEKQYRKKEYWVLKLHSTEGFSFYTSSKENLKDLEGEYVRVRLFTQSLSFLSYLKGFYLPTQMLSHPQGRVQRYVMIEELEKRHSKTSAPLYSALLFAGSIPASLREQLSALGINHLLAISGFHLGVLSFLLFFMIRLLYTPLQGRYFPYRNAQRDIAIAVFILLFGYLYFLDFVPSLLRAFAMSLFAYLMYDRGIRLVSFSSLFLVVFFLIALWPKLLFSLGLWFSVAGVFYIFLFVHHMKRLKVWQSFILLHLWVYMTMLPVVHYFYGSFSLYQLYSPLLSMLFIVFYPVTLLLHLLSLGDVLDPILDYMVELEIPVTQIHTALWVLLLYLGVSFLAIFSKAFFYLLGLFSSLIMAYFLYSVT